MEWVCIEFLSLKSLRYYYKNIFVMLYHFNQVYLTMDEKENKNSSKSSLTEYFSVLMMGKSWKNN